MFTYKLKVGSIIKVAGIPLELTDDIVVETVNDLSQYIPEGNTMYKIDVLVDGEWKPLEFRGETTN